MNVMKKGSLVLWIILFSFNFTGATITDSLKNYNEIGFYNQTEIELFEGIYPKEYIQSRALFEYSSTDSKILIQITEYTSQEILLKKVKESFSQGVSIKYDSKNRSYFSYNDAKGWIGNDYIVEILTNQSFDYDHLLISFITEKNPPNYTLIDSFISLSSNLKTSSFNAQSISSCSELGYSSCSDTSLEKFLNNVRYECNSFAID